MFLYQMRMNMLIALEVIGLIALVIGVLGLRFAFINHRAKRLWIIISIAGLVVAIVAVLIRTLPEETDKEAVEDEIIAFTIIEEPIVEEINEETGYEPVDEGIEEIIDDDMSNDEMLDSDMVTASPAVSWSVNDDLDLNVSVVSGDEKSVTLRFRITNGSSYEGLTVERVTIGDDSYYLANDFAGIPLATKNNGDDRGHFVPGIGVNEGSYSEVEYYMIDGSDLPDSFTIMVDEMEQYTRSSGAVDVYNFYDLAITLTRH